MANEAFYPAYPGTGTFGETHSGVTQRQWYKAKAIEGLFHGYYQGDHVTPHIGEMVALAAKIADAAIAEDIEHEKATAEAKRAEAAAERPDKDTEAAKPPPSVSTIEG